MVRRFRFISILMWCATTATSAQLLISSTRAEGLGLGEPIPTSATMGVSNSEGQERTLFIGNTLFRASGNRIVYIDGPRVSTPEGEIVVHDDQLKVQATIGLPDLVLEDALICPSASLTYTYYSQRNLGVGYFNNSVGKLEIMDKEAWLAKYGTRIQQPKGD